MITFSTRTVGVRYEVVSYLWVGTYQRWLFVTATRILCMLIAILAISYISDIRVIASILGSSSLLIKCSIEALLAYRRLMSIWTLDMIFLSQVIYQQYTLSQTCSGNCLAILFSHFQMCISAPPLAWSSSVSSLSRLVPPRILILCNRTNYWLPQ